MKYRTISFSFALTLLLIVCPLHSEQQKSADAHFQKGESFRLDNALDRALASYRKAIEADKRHVRAHMAYQDMMIRRMGKGDVIRGEYRKLQEAHPGDPVFRFLTARLVDEPVILKEEAEDILQMDQEFYWGYILLGKAFSGMDLDADALEAYKKAAALDPEEAQAYFEMAAIHQRLENLDEAGTLYKQALQKDSSRVEIYAHLTEIDIQRCKEGKISEEQIKTDVESLLKEYPNNVPLLSTLYRITFSLFGDEIDNKIRLRLEILDSCGRFVEEKEFGLVLTAYGSEEKINSFREFLKKYPNSEFKKLAHSNLVNILIKSPHHSQFEVEEVMERWVKEMPGDDFTYNQIIWGHCIGSWKNYKKAIGFLNMGVASAERWEKAVPLRILGAVYSQTGAYDKAVDALNQAQYITLEPDPVIYNLLGNAYLEAGKDDSAMKYLGASLAYGYREFEDVKDSFMKAYERKTGSKEGAETSLYERVFASSAVRKPFEAPDFALSDLEGSKVSLSEHIGKVILLNFWKPG